jgi:hypothetical protein
MFCVGVGLAFTDRSGAATSAWGIAFLLTVLLLLAKFKRFKGFGFEAELWEQKQAEAAALIEQMKSLSKLIGRQMASVAARLGLWDSALSLADLAKFLDDLQQQMKAIDIPSYEIEEALQALHSRIEAGYLAEARHVVSVAFKAASDTIYGSLDSTDVQQHLKAASQTPLLNEESKAVGALPTGAIEPLVDFIRASRIVEPKAEVIHALTEIDLDLTHFRKNRSFRRRDWLRSAAH